jgi:hypothetical protein
LQREDDEDGLGQHWRPSRDGEGDPMMRCPVCSWEHVDDDSGPGVFDGTFREVDDERDRLLPDFADLWTETLANALETANFFRDKLAERLTLVETAVVELEGALACNEAVDPQHWRDHARHAMESSLSLCQRATKKVARANA